MKRILIIALLATLSALSAVAQNDTIWKTGGLFNAAFNQVNLSNWAAGGENSIALNAFTNLYANYRRGKVSWDSNIDLAYGITRQGEEDVRKNDDRLEINTKVGYQTSSAKLAYSALFNFRSQFSDGYNYPKTDSSRYISRFAAPAFALLALGVDYKPNKAFSLMVSPLTARVVIVADDSLSKAGAFGVDPENTIRREFGAYAYARFQQEVVQNVTLMSKLDLFSNYLEDPQNIDLNWELLLALKASKAITVSLGLQMIYDDNTKILLFKESNGQRVPELGADGKQKSGPRLQMRQIFGIGLSYKIAKATVR
ncbi:MAG: DUF3078 domain-containing protein [Bacteroidota bacterium]|jgi:hypothetical protein